MEKIKIYLSKEESKQYEESNDISSCFLTGFKFYLKSKSIINTSLYEFSDVKVIKEAPHLYSLIIKLKENKNAKK